MTPIPQQLIGSSPAFLATLDRISQAAAMDQPTLVVGERGTGKQLMAQRLHFLSPRWEQSYVSVNCAAMDDDTLRDALFDRSGAFERAEGGTLTLLNIDKASLSMQQQVLSVLDQSSFERPGDGFATDVNVRLLATSGVDLPSQIHAGRFNAALLDRLSFDVISLPPLRRRQADILPLAEYFGRKFVVSVGAESFPGFTPEIIEILTEHPWPGNIRQLRVTVERAVSLALTEDNSFAGPIGAVVLDPFDSPWRLGSAPPPNQPETTANIATNADKPKESDGSEPKSFKERIFAFERRMIDQALTAHKDHQGKAAESLDLSYHAFRGLLRKHGLKK